MLRGAVARPRLSRLALLLLAAFLAPRAAGDWRQTVLSLQLLVLASDLQPATANGWSVQWGDDACWDSDRGGAYELCCFPNPRDIGEVFSHIVEEGYATCWDGTFNVSRCCRSGGRFVRLRAKTAAPPVDLQRAFAGCQDARWQAFLFKFRITLGVPWLFCDSFDCLYEYWVRVGVYRTQLTRPDDGPCQLGELLKSVVRFSAGTKLDDDAAAASAPDLSSSARALLHLDAAAGDAGGLFAVIGMTGDQLAYLDFLQGLDTAVSDGTSRAVSAAVRASAAYVAGAGAGAGGRAAAAAAAPLVLDFGMSGGVDAEFYLSRGYQVVGVEANPNVAAEVRARLAPLVRDGWLEIVQAAVGDPEAAGADTVDFYMDDHHWERSGLHADSLHDSLDVKKTTVQLRTCASVYLAAVEARRGDNAAAIREVEYVKIDVEGQDVSCLQSILTATAAAEAPAPPSFVSIELGFAAGSTADEVATRTESLRQLLDGRYCSGKLVRQAIYNSRLVAGHNGLSMPVSRLGLGASGPFGDAAADWRAGRSWRPLAKILEELAFAWMLVRHVNGEWFDLHLRRCSRLHG